MDRRAVFSVTTMLVVISVLAVGLSAAEPVLTSKMAPPLQVKWERDLTTAQSKMVQQKRAMLLYFTSPGCHYCKQLEQQVFSQRWFANQVQRKYTPVRVDGRKQPKLAKQLQVRIYPTVAIIHPSGRVVEIVRGYREPGDFQRHLAVADSRLANHDKQLAAQPSNIK